MAQTRGLEIDKSITTLKEKDINEIRCRLTLISDLQHAKSTTATATPRTLQQVKTKFTAQA